MKAVPVRQTIISDKQDTRLAEQGYAQIYLVLTILGHAMPMLEGRREAYQKIKMLQNPIDLSTYNRRRVVLQSIVDIDCPMHRGFVSRKEVVMDNAIRTDKLGYRLHWLQRGVRASGR
jgi:hypothetical protein